MIDGANARPFPAGGMAVVIGASGGIGAALLQILTRDPGFAVTFGLSRDTQPAIDLTNEATIARAAAIVRERDRPLRLVLDATGFLHGMGFRPERSWRDLDPAHLALSFALNATGPALLMKHFLPMLAADEKSVFATLSAKVGSIGDNRIGGWYAYRAAKAALNQIVRTAAIELGRRRQAAICVALHPGTVATGLSEPFGKTGLDVVTPAAAATRLLRVIDRLEPADTGGFFDYRGEPVPW